MPLACLSARWCVGLCLATWIALAIGCRDAESAPTSASGESQSETSATPKPPAAESKKRPARPDDLISRDHFVAVSDPASPRVAYALHRGEARLIVGVEVEGYTPAADDVGFDVGLAADRVVRLSSDQSDQTGAKDRVRRWYFQVPADQLVDSADGWGDLRLALAVRWNGGAVERARQRERFRHLDRRAAFHPLSDDPADWAPLDLKSYERRLADRRQRLVVELDQPLDGKLTVVIDDADGRRVRNLVAGVAAAKGGREIEWDGRNEDGQLVEPGEYHWRAISHAGIRPEYLFNWCNGNDDSTTGRSKLSNHGYFSAATHNEEYVFLGARVTEGGWSLIAADRDGDFKHGYDRLHGTGLGMVKLAADEKYLYVAKDGIAWGQKPDRSDPQWRIDVNLSISRFDIEAARPVNFPGGRRDLKYDTYPHGRGAEKMGRTLSLAGFAHHEGTLFVSSRWRQAIIRIDAATGEELGDTPMPEPGPLAVGGETLYATSENAVYALTREGRRQGRIIDGGEHELAIRALACDDHDRLYVCDDNSHTVRIFDARNGEPLSRIGEPGGPYAGEFVPERMVHPRGITVFKNRLWVTQQTTNPKRIVGWDLDPVEVAVQMFGNPPYGSPGAGFDPKDKTRWIGQNVLWRLDFAGESARVTHVPKPQPGHLDGLIGSMRAYRFFHHELSGRTFVIGTGNHLQLISELMPDGTMRDLAAISTIHHFHYATHWRMDGPYVEAMAKHFPDANPRKKYSGHRGLGVMWIDRNGDSACQPDEFRFSGSGSDWRHDRWGNVQQSLTYDTTVALDDGSHRRVRFQPEGFNEVGAPIYPSFEQVIARGVPITGKPESGFDWTGLNTGHARDRFGNLVMLSNPMVGIDEQGRITWRYPNPWSGVHGSHRAPLPEVGVMQGTLFFLGIAPLDDRGDVTLIVGNHGRVFAVTSDGMYLDEMFNDTRMGAARDEWMIGGEAFGGYFGMADDGDYLLQAGPRGYQLFRVRGFDTVQRQRGTLSVTRAQLATAERRMIREAESADQAREAVVEHLDDAPSIDGKHEEYDAAHRVTWRDGKFGVDAQLAYDADRLYLHYKVRDDSPWRNSGKDWATLFKTGDSIDVQLGGNPEANPDRRDPGVGDLRLLIAPMDGEPVAVLYRPELSGGPSGNEQTFSSPWRNVTFDDVHRVDAAEIAVRTQSGYYEVEAAVPWSALGLASPAGQTLRGDLGAIFSDRDGTLNLLRSYWANRATGLVNDVPGEAMLTPRLWGTLKFQDTETDE